MPKFLLCFIFFISYSYTFSQNITIKLIDKNSRNPIQYASIKTGEYSGVISNEEGYFTINTNNNSIKSITISCLGYQNKTISIEGVEKMNFTIELEEAFNQLNEVFISNKKPNADSIIAKVKAKLGDNYTTELNKYSIFKRTTDYVDFENLNFEIEKASHVKKQNIEKANAGLNKLSRDIINSKTIYFTDFKGELYTFNKDSSKLIVNKATKLIDQKNDLSLDNIQERAQGIVLKYLDTTLTYKLKSGLFKIEDSLSLKDEEFKDNNKDSLTVKYLNSGTRNLLRKSQFFDNSFLMKFLDSRLYDFTFEDFTYNNNNLTYIITFKPRKGKAKYEGKLFVNEDDYAITKVDYEYHESRHGQKLNLKLLLGIKFIENLNEGTILYQKNEANKYHPRYIKQTRGSYFYVNRDLKFIENSKAKNKVGFSFKVEGNNRNKEELLFTSSNAISLENFSAIKQNKKVPIKTLSAFEKELWKNEETLEPTQEMKAFKVED